MLGSTTTLRQHVRRRDTSGWAFNLPDRARDDANHRFLKERDRLAGASVNGIQMIETLKAGGTEGDFFARWSGLHVNALDAQQRLGVVTMLANTAPPLLLAASVIAVLGAGGPEAHQRDTPGGRL